MTIGKKNEEDPLASSSEKILGLIEDLLKALEHIHSEIGDTIEELYFKDAKVRDAYKTKAQLRDSENKKIKETARSFKALLQKVKWGTLIEHLYKCVNYWVEKIAPKLEKCEKKMNKETIDTIKPIPYKLAAFMFFLGDYYKACIVLKTCLYIEPGNSIVRSLLIRWCVYLGEPHILDSRLEAEKKLTKKYIIHQQVQERIQSLAKVAQLYIDFQRTSDKNKIMEQLCTNLKEVAEKKEHSFSSVEYESLLLYIVGHFGKSSQATKDTPDPLYCILQRTMKCDNLLRNRVRGIFHDNQRVDFRKLLDDHVTAVEIFSTYAEYNDSCRDFIVESYNLGFVREALNSSEVALKIAYKMGCFSRAITMATLSMLCVHDVNVDASPISEEHAKLRVHLLSTANKVEPASPGRCTSPARQILSKLQESFEELNLVTSVKRLHEYKKECFCELCRCKVNMNEFMMEYLCTTAIYHGFEEIHIAQMNGNFSILRQKINEDQCQLLDKAKKGLKMKPPQWFCEIYSLVALRWLRQQEFIGRPYLRDTGKADLRKSVIDQVYKFYEYGRQKFLPYYLTCRQILRHDVVGDMSYAPYSWMLEKNETASSRAIKEHSIAIERSVAEALQDYTNYSDLLYRDWRYPLCTFLGRFSKDLWLSAAMWSESTILTTRSSARLVSGKLDSYVFNRTSSFQSLVQNLPRDFTVTQLATDENETLYIVKLYAERIPLIIPVASRSKIMNLRKKMLGIMKSNEDSSGASSMTPSEFWMNRRKVDAELKAVVKAGEEYLFGPWAPFLLPSQSLTSRGRELATGIVKLCSTEKSLFNQNIAEELVALCGQITSEQWIQLITVVGELYQLEEEKIATLKKDYSKLYKRVNTKGVVNKELTPYSFLAICPALSIFPFEAMDIFKDKPQVGRIVSVSALFRQVMKNSTLPKKVDVSNSFYVLDPDNNLLATQKRMTEFLAKFSMKGIVGSAPNASDLKNILQEKDILFFLGHGSGSKHLPKRTIKESKCNAVSVLMGCGSVTLEHDGWGLDGKSTAYDYTVANCPAVIGCLWMVTDGEIDRYFMALVKLCFSSETNTTINDGQERLRDLIESMRKAKAESKLPYLTGAAVINYGLPVTSCD